MGSPAFPFASVEKLAQLIESRERLTSVQLLKGFSHVSLLKDADLNRVVFHPSAADTPADRPAAPVADDLDEVCFGVAVVVSDVVVAHIRTPSPTPIAS